jgi:hypothetical protein
MARRPRQVPEYETMGEIPAAASGIMLHGDPMTSLATGRQDDAAAVAQHSRILGAVPDAPVIVRTAANEEWTPLMLAIPAGVAVEIIGRDEDRETFDVTNQSKAVTGTTALLFLFREQREAESFADDSAAVQANRLAQGVRMIVLPDGAGRTFTHTASMWAVAYGVVGGVAVLDVSAERRNRYRR